MSEFFSIDPEEAATFLDGEGDDHGELVLPPEQYFSADDGLATVRALLPMPGAEPALRDLHDCERILSIAGEHGIGWHFAMDI